MNTGHDGSLSTVHANGVDDAVRRLETLVLMAGVGLPAAAVREQLGSAVDLIAHLERSADGSRRVVEVAEIDLGDGGEPGVRVVARGDQMVAPRRVTGRRAVTVASDDDAGPSAGEVR